MDEKEEDIKPDADGNYKLSKRQLEKLVNKYVEEELEKEAKRMEHKNVDADSDDLSVPFKEMDMDSDVESHAVEPEPEPEPLPGQVENEQGGYSYLVSRLDHLKRFIVLGTEGSTYYAKQEERERQKLECVLELLQNGFIEEVLDILVEYSTQGRVYKEDSILYVLAMCCQNNDTDIRKKSYEKLPVICNIPTKLFKFIDLCQTEIGKERKAHNDLGHLPKKELKRKRRQKTEPVESEEQPSVKKTKKQIEKENRKADPYKLYHTKAARSAGWGRLRRKGVGSFYTDPHKSAERLLYLLTKYKKRNNWSHKQVLGYTHPKISLDDDEKVAKDLVLSYCIRGEAGYQKKLRKIEPGLTNQVVDRVRKHIEILEKVSELSPKKAGDEEKLLDILKEHGVRDAADDFTSAFAFGSYTSQTSQTSFTTVNENTHKKSPFQIVREHIPTAFLKSPKVRYMLGFFFNKYN